MTQDCIVILSDDKPGHLNQSIGLADALLRLRPELAVQELPAMPRYQALKELLWPREPREDIRLLIGAGHATHLSLLALRRAYRCPAIVLMRPSLPGVFFDLRIEPRHDGGRDSDRCWLSDGPLNRMQPSADRSSGGLILLGGPSPHFVWDGAALLEQIKRLCKSPRQWQLSGSRRTPGALLDALLQLEIPNLRVHKPDALPKSWLASELPKNAECWVSPDSASMVYEALTAGCAVGVFDLLPITQSRVAKAIDGLGARQLITPFSAFAAGSEAKPPATPFAEADRCAQRIIERGWL